MQITAKSPFAALNANPAAKQGETEVREAFRDFTAGTVYKQMLKSMRKMHDEPAYFNGGNAEKTFRAMLDEKVAESMAESHGGSISDPLFDSFRARIPVSQVVGESAKSESP